MACSEEMKGAIMYSKVFSSAVYGVEGTAICVEADVSDGLPMFNMVGYLSSSVKEAAERVRTALRNSGFFIPPKRITINLSPADIRKDGSCFDLPIAVSVLLSMGITTEYDLSKIVFIGELGLDGSVLPVSGVLPMVYHCFGEGIDTCIIPRLNLNEAALVKDMNIIAVDNLQQVIEYLQGLRDLEIVIGGNYTNYNVLKRNNVDFSDIKGQEMLKRGMEIAASGFHNVLMSGAAGAGKSMLAKALPSIMPELSFEEKIEVTKIYSSRGLLENIDSLISERPFRSPHHTISNHALIGGGSIPRPGEVTLAHNGVLFLDELPEFNKNVLEVLRQPLEDRKITISRMKASYIFPADFMLVAAMNPCPCGRYPDLSKCNCTPNQIKQYQGKISGPLLDRIDINMEVKPIKYEDLIDINLNEESSEKIRERVEKAREIQENRYKNENIRFNAQLDAGLIKKYISLNSAEEEMLMHAYKTKDMSARGLHRILKLARTIADMDGKENIDIMHIREALFYKR